MEIDWLELMEVKRKRRRRLKLAGIVTAVALLIVMVAFVGFYINLITPNVYGPGPIELQIAPDKPFFQQGEHANFTITIINNQSWPISKPLSESALIEKDGKTVSDRTMNINYGVKIPTYPANSTTSLPWTWFKSDNVSREAGNYTMTFILRGDGYDAKANCTFIIR